MSANPYDLVPYPSAVIPPARADRVLLAAWFQGGPAPEPAPRRICEIGSSDGSNLLAGAFYRPQHQYIGMDRAERPVEAARTAVRELGLSNLEFRVGDIRTRDDQPKGPFQVIVAHGFYSWVDAASRAALLDFCRAELSEHGVAYISYNTQPGWKLRGLVREILWQAGSRVEDPLERSRVAMEAAARLRRMIPESPHPYQQYLARELDLLAGFDPAYVLHDYLSPDNEPFYVREFVETAARHGLRYVGDAGFNRADGRLPDGMEDSFAAETLDGIERESFMDILCNRQFRYSLVTHDDTPQTTGPALTALDDVVLWSSLTPTDPAWNPDPGLQETFTSETEDELSIEGLPARAMLHHLHAAGMAGARFADVLRAVEARVGEALTEPVQVDLRETLVVLYKRNLVDLRLDSYAVPLGDSGSPHALARWEAGRRRVLSRPDHEVLVVDAALQDWIAGKVGAADPSDADRLRLARAGILVP